MTKNKSKKVILVNIPQQPIPPVQVVAVLEAQIAFVDGRFGTVNGVLEDRTRPFLTINLAINAIIQRAVPIPSALTRWTVFIAPGTYTEDVVVPAFVNLEGESQQEVIIAGKVTSAGQSSATTFTVLLSSDRLPALDITVVSVDAAEKTLVQDTTFTITKGSLDSIPNQDIIAARQQSGINGQVDLLNVSVDGDLTNFTGGEVSLLRNGGINVNARGLNADYLTSPTVFNSSFPSDGLTIVEGGSLRLVIVNSAITAPVALFHAPNSGSIIVRNHEANVINTILGSNGEFPDRVPGAPQQALADAKVHYALVGGSGRVIAVNSVLNFEGVPSVQRVLARAESPGSSVFLSDIYTSGTFVPAIEGIVENIRYFAVSVDGNLVSSGGEYTSIRTINADNSGAETFLQDFDRTLLMADPQTVLLLEDPEVVNTEVLYKGKYIVVKNVGVNVATIQGRIFDGPIIGLIPNESAAFQNDGIQWYRL